jgi:ATP-dependent Clp protease ATP-binding subunit ClpC
VSKTANPAEVLAQWLERDLTAAAARGELPPAFEVDEVIEQLAEILESGRHPVLAGEPGVGKTAVVQELVRRAARGEGPPALAGRRVLQFSFQHRAAALLRPDQLRPETQKLWDALAPQSGQVVPFLRDFHVAYHANLEPQLQALALRWPGPILAEGDRATILAMFETFPELGERYVLLDVQEPDLERAQRILDAWARELAPRGGASFSPDALEEALQLCHRFLPRSRLPRKVLDLLGQVAALSGPRPIGPADVLERFCRANRVPRLLVDPRERLDLAEVEAVFRAQLLGQDEAVRSVVRTVGLIKAGLADVRRPFGVFLFVGPTGVGKTHLAQLLAEYLFGSRDRLVRLNMADFQKEEDALLLFGNPELMPLALRRGVLTQRLLGQPFAVLLLDELEKAHEKVHDRFLQLIDEGCFINGAGETVSCRANVIIATSNAGAEVYRGHLLGFRNPSDWPALEAEVGRRVQERFRFEFLNRFDQVVHFRPLTREEIRAIAQRELRGLAQRPGLKRRGIRLEVDEAVLDWLALHGYDPHYGARVLRRTIERHVTAPLAEAIVRADPAPGAALELTVRRNQIVARFPERAPAAARPAPAPPAAARPRSRTDAEALHAEADRLLAAAERRLQELEARRQERSALLERLNQARDWESPEGAELLARYRALDVTLLAEQRLAAPLLRLKRVREDPDAAETPAALAHTVEAAARSLGDWDARAAEEGRAHAWMLIRVQDALKPAREWVRDLTVLELAWLRRLHLSAEVVAYEAGEEPACTVLDVEGPGARALLALEEGQHRLLRGRGRTLRARIDVIPQGPLSAEGAPPVSPVRRRRGHFDMAVAFRGRLQLRDQGVALDFLAAQREVLAHALADLAAAWPGPDRAEVDLARVYGEDGRGARDPRTGAVVARLKDAMKGRLDPLLEAWRRRDPPPPRTP